jgi:TusA-related sulfurtransferase
MKNKILIYSGIIFLAIILFFVLKSSLIPQPGCNVQQYYLEDNLSLAISDEPSAINTINNYLSENGENLNGLNLEESSFKTVTVIIPPTINSEGSQKEISAWVFFRNNQEELAIDQDGNIYRKGKCL